MDKLRVLLGLLDQHLLRKCYIGIGRVEFADTTWMFRWKLGSMVSK